MERKVKEEIVPLARRVDEKGNLIGDGDIIMCRVGYYPAKDDLAVAKKRLTLQDGKHLRVRNA